MKKEAEEIKETGTKNAEEVGTENASPLFNFDLPPVSEQTDDFIQADIETPETVESNEVEGFTENSEAEKHRGALDDKGNPYDPLIHAYPPEKTGKLQKWKKKPKKEIEQAAVNEVKSNASYRTEATKFAQLYGNLHMIPFGQQGGAVIKEELLPLIDSLERYMLENGHSELPAGIDLLISSGMYSFNVTQRESNREKVNKFFKRQWENIKRLFGVNQKKKQNPEMNPKGQGGQSA